MEDNACERQANKYEEHAEISGRLIMHLSRVPPALITGSLSMVISSVVRARFPPSPPLRRMIAAGLQSFYQRELRPIIGETLYYGGSIFTFGFEGCLEEIHP